MFDKAMDVLEYIDQWKIQPNAQLYTSLITACANYALLSYGRKVHAHILASNVAINLVLGNALINMYSKGGDVNKARTIFMSMKDKYIITWTALLSGYSLVGDGKTALEIFHEMKARCIVPDEAVAICVLQALSHSGMIDESVRVIASLTFPPTLKIRTCLVDCLARLGRLQEAEEMVLGMHDADCQAWMSVLGACRTYLDVERAERVMQEIIKMEPLNASAYSLLSNIYADAGEWEMRKHLQQSMEERGIKKNPSITSTEVNGKVHTFVAGDPSHLIDKQVRQHWKELLVKLRSLGYMPSKTVFEHSEKLAICYALQSTPPGTEITLVTSLKMCKDCHNAVAFISRVERRTILVRDSSRIHRFETGICSCTIMGTYQNFYKTKD
jgi:pentatricopeptide repeat protein